MLNYLPSSVGIILYQDSFEVDNPLGSGKHKILAVYLTPAEIAAHGRYSIDQMQLVLLCREEDLNIFFGQEKVFSAAVNDLKEMEENGIHGPGGNIVRDTVLAITGDNLGSHCIGGFFSKSRNFCRYCPIDRETWEQIPTKSGPVRSVETNNNCVAEGEKAYGVQLDPVVNQLKPGLPPCLGHDLFEGIVSVDLVMYIKHLVKTEKQFTCQMLWYSQQTM